MSGFSVFVTREIPERGLNMLREASEITTLDINPDDRVLSREELLAGVKGRDAVLCLLTDPIDDEVFDTAKGAKIFANYAVGFNNVDLDAAARHGMPVSNTPGVLNDATATMAFTLLLSTARRIVESDKYLRAGKYKGWGPMLLLGADVAGRTLGVVGGGRIGTAVARRAQGFGMNLVYSDVYQCQPIEDLGAQRRELNELLAESDFVTLHTVLDDSTHHLMSDEQFKLMKKTAILVNTSRGPVVDEAALARALKAGEIAGAGIDVYEKEPEVHADLIGLDSAVLTPHTASATHETRSRMAEIAAGNLLAALRGERPENLVNPEVWDKAHG